MSQDNKKPPYIQQIANGDDNIQIIGDQNIVTRIKNFLFDEIGNINALLITLILVEVFIYVCAFSLVGVASEKAGIGLLEAYFFCGCFPFIFGPLSLWGLIRAVQLGKPKTVVLGCIAGFLSILVFLVIAILVFGIAVIQN